MNQDKVQGLLLGLALGDALGLPAEGLSRKTLQRRWSGRWRHRLLLSCGWFSDDTEQAFFVTQALLTHPDNVDAFARRLAWSLRGWFLGLPAGIGFATLRAILKLWLGFSPRHSGVFSAGNGAAMRVAPIAAAFARNKKQRQSYVLAASRLTHSDPKAGVAALAIVEICAWMLREAENTPHLQKPEASELLLCLRSLADVDAAWLDCITHMETAIQQQDCVSDFADRLGQHQGVSGYSYHSVPVAIYAWYHHFGDFEQTLSAVFRCGGDTDTVGAMAGAMAGCVCGYSALPDDWLAGLCDWPRSHHLLLKAGANLAQQQPGQRLPALSYAWWFLPLRNFLFLLVVLGHGFLRLWRW
ncbi:ADP-ribosylglycohydrolase family protein [Candidatus Venteria ishoeyi]|uniref:ADP-ribosylglycohydrolase family protein n=1 Tax=Candidatus Venteria ishoeyi TaxID=1899563 RepID=UPI0025A57B0E|nr:ADP-ribosylglycohydrolase family protein [Candidatus Venteria ishoeyi]MDM8546720.1 ADP-ribosylglycohydrolase family protein [Candidatus Venteria ishoeyi]